MAGDGQSPTAVRKALGSRLRQMRDDLDMTVAQAAEASGVGASTVTKVELAHMVPSLKTLQAIIGAYGDIDDGERELLLSMHREANRKEWWERRDIRLPEKFGLFLGLESLATVKQVYDCTVVHGLLQTPDYARALLRGTRPDLLPHEVEQRVEMRMRRKELLTREEPRPLELWWVADEAVLRRQIGGPEIMHAQIEHLIGVSDMSNVHILVMPNSMGAHPAMDGPFEILQFEAGAKMVAYSEGQAGNIYLERDDDLRQCQQTMTLTIAASPGPERSLAILKQLSEETKP